jgi:hypothetical protein
MPKEVLKFEIRLVSTSNIVHLSALQMEEGYQAKPYVGLPGKSTIEYEGRHTTSYIPEPEVPKLRKHFTASYCVSGGVSNPTFPLSVVLHPLSRDDVDLNGTESEMPNGFLTLQEDGSTTDFKLGKGGYDLYRDSTGAPVDYLGRSLTSYAKVSGLSKLVQRQTFHLSGALVEDELASDLVVLASTEVAPIIPEASYLGPSYGFNITMGSTYVVATTLTAISNAQDEDLHIETSANKDTVLSVLFLDQFRNPMYGTVITVSQTRPLTATLSAITINSAIKTNQAGVVQYKHRPFSDSTGAAIERVTFTSGSLSFTFVVDVI